MKLYQREALFSNPNKASLLMIEEYHISFCIIDYYNIVNNKKRYPLQSFHL